VGCAAGGSTLRVVARARLVPTQDRVLFSAGLAPIVGGSPPLTPAELAPAGWR